MSKFKILSFYAFTNVYDIRQKLNFIKAEPTSNPKDGFINLAVPDWPPVALVGTYAPLNIFCVFAFD